MLITDIEGYEHFALRELQQSLRVRAIKNVICEIHPGFIKEHNGPSQVDVISLLSECVYEAKKMEKSSNSRAYYIYATPTNY